MTGGQAHRFTQWQDWLTVDILEQPIPAIADDLADWYCRNHRPALDPASFPEELRSALLRRAGPGRPRFRHPRRRSPGLRAHVLRPHQQKPRSLTRG